MALEPTAGERCPQLDQAPGGSLHGACRFIHGWNITSQTHVPTHLGLRGLTGPHTLTLVGRALSLRRRLPCICSTPPFTSVTWPD